MWYCSSHRVSLSLNFRSGNYLNDSNDRQMSSLHLPRNIKFFFIGNVKILSTLRLAVVMAKFLTYFAIYASESLETQTAISSLWNTGLTGSIQMTMITGAAFL